MGISGGMAYRIVMQGYKPKDVATSKRLKSIVAADYDAWRAANQGRLLAIVAWAETAPAERVWPPEVKA
jgi:hypothetical protein